MLCSYRFPQNIDIKKKWLAKVHKLYVGNSTVICSDHFATENYEQRQGRVKLFEGAYPTLKLSFVTNFY